MPDNAESLFRAALELTVDERLSLVGLILDTLPTEDDAAWLEDPQLAEELERRFADSTESISWSDLRAEN